MKAFSLTVFLILVAIATGESSILKAQQPAAGNAPPVEVAGEAPAAGTKVQEGVAGAAVDGERGPTAEQIARLEKYLTGSRFTGSFTVTGQEQNAPRAESYWIERAVKNPEGNQWTITARIQYGTHDVKVPMVMEILWAGDTPVITVDKLTIPLMGTFDARVLIRGGQYAGTWRHDEVGGHLFGRITTAEEAAREAAEVPAGDGESPAGKDGQSDKADPAR